MDYTKYLLKEQSTKDIGMEIEDLDMSVSNKDREAFNQYLNKELNKVVRKKKLSNDTTILDIVTAMSLRDANVLYQYLANNFDYDYSI